MIKTRMFVCALICALVSSSVATAANVDLSLNLDFNTPGDLSSGGTWTAVVTADESGLAGVSFLAENVNNDASSAFEGLSAFEVFESQQVGLVIEVVTGDDLNPPTLDVGVVGGTFPTSYVEPAGIAPLAGQPDLGSFAGAARIATGTFGSSVPDLLASLGTLAQGANVFNASGAAIPATLNTTVRTVIPEPTTILLFSLGLMGTAVVRRR